MSKTNNYMLDYNGNEPESMLHPLTIKLIEETGYEPFYMVQLPCLNTFKISKSSLDKIKRINDPTLKITFIPCWYRSKNGYIVCMSKTKEKKLIYMHRYLLDQHVYSSKTDKSVDHMNRDRCDNRLENLRLCTQSEQNHNKDSKPKKVSFIKGLSDDPIQLPQYIEYFKKGTLKSNTTGKETITQAHFIVDSRYFNFSHHASKSSKLTIKERLKDALCKRYNAVINSKIKFENIYIDGFHFDDQDDFMKHTLEQINVYCDIQADSISYEATNKNNYDPSNGKIDDNLTFPDSENTKLNKSNLPKRVRYQPTSDKRGSALIYEQKNPKKFTVSSSSSKKFTLDEKLSDLLKKLNSKNIKLEWINKPSCVTDNDLIVNKAKDPDNIDFFQKCLKDVIAGHNQKENISREYNELDVKIIQKLDGQLIINNSVTGDILGISDDNVSRIRKGKWRTTLELDKITSQILERSEFIEEYKLIKLDIIKEVDVRKALKVHGITSSNSKNWKVTVDTVIKMILDKKELSYQQIANKYKDKDENSLKVTTVQNMIGGGRAYWLTKDDFENIHNLTYDDYVKKRKENIHAVMNTKLHTKPKIDAKKDDQENDSDTKTIQYPTRRKDKQNFTKDEFKHAKTTSIGKRSKSLTSDILLEIYSHKFKKESDNDIAKLISDKRNVTLKFNNVKDVWNGNTQLFNSDFENATNKYGLTFQKYNETFDQNAGEIKKKLRQKSKYDDLVESIKKGIRKTPFITSEKALIKLFPKEFSVEKLSGMIYNNKRK